MNEQTICTDPRTLYADWTWQAVRAEMFELARSIKEFAMDHVEMESTGVLETYLESAWKTGSRGRSDSH